MKRILLAAAAVMLASAAFAAPAIKTQASAAGNVMADDKGMVLYTYDRDTKGAAASACTGGCVTNWPAFLAPTDAKADGDWTIVNAVDKDGKAIKQWAFKGLPIYYYAKDAKVGDSTGEGVGGIWHVVKM